MKIKNYKKVIIANKSDDFYNLIKYSNDDFVIITNNDQYVGYVDASNPYVINNFCLKKGQHLSMYNRDNIIPFIDSNNNFLYVKRIYNDKYLLRKKYYYNELKRIGKVHKEYFSNYDNVVIIGENRFSKLLSKLIPSSKIISYKDNYDKNCFIITTNLYKYKMYNGISMKLFIKELINKELDDNNRLIVNNYINKVKRLGVNVLTVKIPISIENLTPLELERKIKNINPNNQIISINHIKDLYDNVEEFNSFHKDYLSRPGLVKCGDLLLFSDFQSKNINIINGERKTIGQPLDYKNHIYLIGACIVNGHYASDDKTIASYLQKQLLDYEVKSFGGTGNYWLNYIKILDYLELKQGDIVVLLSEKSIFKSIDIDMTDTYNKLHKTTSFFWNKPIHCTEKGYKCIAETLIPYIKKYKHGDIIVQNSRTILNDDIKKYVKYLDKYRVKHKRIGAIVMNCNPFTYGHLYLITEALKKIDYLYIFVVEEDKSFFKYKDRLKMVLFATKNMPNVCVIPSGKYVLSSITFPEYFNKDNEKNVVVDCSTDINNFSNIVATVLNIKYRFVGTEPTDMVTNQYNKQMKHLLSSKGIKLIEIERLKNNDKIVSATSVRSLIMDNNLEQIKEYVPNYVYRIVRRKYVRGNNIK